MTDVNVYVCKESAAFEHDGEMVVIHKGVTRVRAGHPMLKEHPELFEPINVHYDLPDVERATAEPGEKRALTTPPPKKPEAAKKVESTKTDTDDVEALRTEAEKAGVTVDKRWGAERLKQEIAAAQKSRDHKE